MHPDTASATPRNYVGSAFITLNREMRERLWERVQHGIGKALEGIDKPTTEWAEAGPRRACEAP